MTAEQLARSAWIFEEALALQGAELAEFLDRECAGDAEVRAEVVRLLHLHPGVTQSFLEAPASEWADPSELDRGQKVGRYEIQEKLGAGGMSVVYRAVDTGIGRQVALKLIRPTDASSGESTKRFFGELRMLGALQLENVVRVYDYGQFRGLPFIIMECLEGEDLSKALAANRGQSFAAKLDIAKQLAAILRDVHAARIVHRDIKPGNVFLEPNGRVKLMDFGIAREDRQGGGQASMLMGTPEYIAPEQVKGESASHLSDVYSCGILLFELFSGTRPYEGNVAELLHKTVSEAMPLERLRAAGTPKRLIALIDRMTAKEPLRRIQNFDLILDELNHAAISSDAPAPSSRARTRLAIGLGAAAVAVALPAVAVYLRSTQTGNAPSREYNAPVSQPDAAPARIASEAARDERKPLAPIAGDPPKNEEKQPKAKSSERRLAVVIGAANNAPVPARELFEGSGLPIVPAAEATHGTPASLPSSLQGLSATVLAPQAPNVPRTEPPPDPHAQDSRAISAVLERYAQAWRQKDLNQIRRIYPGAPLRQLKQVFDDAAKLDFRLVERESPRFAGEDPLTARIQCLRTTSQFVNNGPPRVSSGDVNITLERLGGAWRIVSID